MIGTLLGRITAASHEPALFGLTVLVHSTVVLIVGLAGLKALELKGTGAGARSVFLRVCLCVAMATPATAAFSKYFHMPRFHITAPITEPAPVKRAPSSDGPAAVSAVPSPQTADFSSPGETPPFPAASRPAGGPTPAIHAPVFRIPAGFPAFLLVFAWVSLSLFLAFRAGVVSLYYRRMRALSQPADGRHIALCRSVAGELNAQAPPVLKNKYINGSFITGLFHPVVMIPSGDQESVMTTREVFLHEIAHVVRRDHVWLYIGHLGKILLPLQPLMWMLVRAIKETNDFACDDYVLHTTGKQYDYAEQLVELAASMRPYSTEARDGIGIFSRGTHLRRRIGHILDTSLARRFKPDAAESVSFTLLFLCTLTCTGLVGVRGKPFEQIRTLPETVSRKAATVALAAAAVVKEQVRAALAPPARMEQSMGAELSVMEHVSDVSATGAPAPDESGVTTVPAPATSEEVRESPATALVADSQSRIGALPVQPAAPATLPAESFTEVSAARASDEKAAAPVLPPSFIGLQTALSGGGEIVAAKPGPLSITVPPDAPGALRESLAYSQENPVWSPNGRIIAFTGHGGNGIWAVRVSGGKPELVFDTTPDNPETALSSSARILSFSPAGDALAYVRFASMTINGDAHKTAAVNAVFTQAIETVNLLTGERRVLVKSATDGCWSPDGRLFAYVEGDGYGIRMLDTRTGETKPLTETGSSPTFTPDGASIIYTSWGGGIFDQLYRIPIGGGNPEQLTNEGCWLNPRCSPDGKWVLCSGYQNGGDPSFTQLRALNLRDLKTYGMYIVRTGAAKMGTWSPRGNQYCFTLADETTAQGKSIARSAIYIEDFSIGNILDSMGASIVQPAEFKLIGNFPNPFNASTSIRFSVPGEGLVELSVFSMNGQKVRDLVSRNMSAGTHTIQWDGRDQYGKKVSSGVYISRLKMEREVETRRMTFLK